MADEMLGQDDIERLLAEAKESGPADAPPQEEAPAEPDETASLGQNEIEALLSGQASSAAPVAADAPDEPAEPKKKEKKPLESLGQDDIEALIGNTQSQTKPPPRRSRRRGAAESPDAILEGDVDLLFDQAQQALDSVENDTAHPHPDALPFQFEDFTGAAPSAEHATLELIRDVELELKIELGRTNMFLEEVLKLRKGAVVPLDKLAGDPVDIFVNGRLIARGEVLVLNDSFCVRVAELVTGEPATARAS